MIDSIEVVLITISICVIIFMKLLDKSPAPIFGVYQRRNGFYWFKVAIGYCLLSVKKIRSSFKRNDVIQKLEKLQQLSNEQSADTVCISGGNVNGDHLSVRLERRKDCTNGELNLKINSSQLGVLRTPDSSKTPTTKLEDIGYEFSADGIKLLPLEPSKKWRLIYKGKMVENGNVRVEHNVKIDGVWTSDKPSFYFDSDMDQLQTSKCLAYEKFNRTHFQNLKVLSQTCSEQFGSLKLNITIEKKSYEIDLDTIKYRSAGNCEDWSRYYRCGYHYFTTENGDCFSIGDICQPISSSRFSFGHVYSANDKKIHPIKDTSLKIYQYGGIKVPPKDYGFTFSAGKQNYAVQVRVLESFHFYIGSGKESKVYDRFSSFRLNGMKGWGTSQWLYRNIAGERGCSLDS